MTAARCRRGERERRSDGGDLAKNPATPARSEARQNGVAGKMRASKRNEGTTSRRGTRKGFLPALLTALLVAAFFAPRRRRSPRANPFTPRRKV